MSESRRVYPAEENIGCDCMYWHGGCAYPKVELRGRTSCEGAIDDVCLYVKDGRIPPSLDPQQILDLKTRSIDWRGGHDLPPGSAE